MTTTTSPRAGDDRGLTLIEVVIAVALLLFITTAVYKTFDRTSKQVMNLQGMVEKQASARNALAGIQGELRNAYSGNETVSHVSTMTATKITFYSADRETPLHLRQITYELKSGSLVRSMRTTTNTYTKSPMTWTWGAWSAERSVLTGVTNTALFTYKDASGVVTTDPKDVRLVEVVVTVKDPKAPNTQQPETYSTSVRTRGVG